MIAIVFLLGLLGVTIFAAATGTQALPIAEILMLVGRTRHSWRAHWLFVFRQALVGLHGANALGAVFEFRSGGGAAIPPDGRDFVACWPF
jgi:hypothetical protein